MAGSVIKSGISYNKYIWHANENACEACQKLNGKEFLYEEDIPDRPHPNCLCWVEAVNGDEPCDCQEKIDRIMEQVEELDGDVESIMDEINIVQFEVTNYVNEIQSMQDAIIEAIEELKYVQPCSGACMVQSVANKVYISSGVKVAKFLDSMWGVLDFISTGYDIYRLFKAQKQQMIDANDKREDIDKYYHAKANCESAELGIIEAMWAAFWSLAKEIHDFKRKVLGEGDNAKLIFVDCMTDLKADLYGLMKAREHGYCAEKVKDAPAKFPGPNREEYEKNNK